MGIGAENAFNMAHHMMEKLFAPEIWAYNWVAGKVHGLFGHEVAEKVAEPAAAVDPTPYHDLPENEYRFVDYYAQSCPHCVDLTPKWHAAEQKWAQLQHDPKLHVVWEQKQCLDDKWEPGKDWSACNAEQIRAFPTLKLFGPGGKEMPFEGQRTEDTLVEFMQQRVGELPMPEQPETSLTPADHEVPAENSAIMYYAAACPHCVKMKPAWEEAAKSWNDTHTEKIHWEEKECLDSEWKAGGKFEDCIREEVPSFPTIRFETKDGVVHDFDGSRSVEGLHKFVEDELQQYQAQHSGEEHHDEAPVAVEENEHGVGVPEDEIVGRKITMHESEVPVIPDQESLAQAKMASMMDPRVLVAGVAALGNVLNRPVVYDARKRGAEFL